MFTAYFCSIKSFSINVAEFVQLLRLVRLGMFESFVFFFVGTKCARAQDFNSADFLDVTPCNLLEKYQYYGKTTAASVCSV